MSKFEKAKKRILEIPADYTYTEMKYLLGKMGFCEYNKGKTSGSRVKFYRESHQGNIMEQGAVKDIVSRLIGMGEL